MRYGNARGRGVTLLLLFTLLISLTIPATAETYTIEFEAGSGNITDMSTSDEDDGSDDEQESENEPPKKEESSGGFGGGGYYMPPAENNSTTINETNVTTVIEEPPVYVPEPQSAEPPELDAEVTEVYVEPSALSVSEALGPGAIKLTVIGLGIIAVLAIVYASRSFLGSIRGKNGREIDDEEQLEE